MSRDVDLINWLTDEERKYLLLIHANGSIAFVPSQDAELARLLDLGLVFAETIGRECIILRLSAEGTEVVEGL